MKVHGELDHSNHRRSWEAEDLSQLRSYINAEMPIPRIAASMGRTQEAVSSRARREGLLHTRKRRVCR